jgi:hypothetical protein
MGSKNAKGMLRRVAGADLARRAGADRGPARC